MENHDIHEENQAPVTAPKTAPLSGQAPPSAPKTQAGPIVGSIIVIIVIIFGGLYFIGKKVNTEGLLAPTAEEILQETDATTEMLGTQSTSDEVDVIEDDLSATELGDLDAELGDIEAELGF